jgi:hypothetical protein
VSPTAGEALDELADGEAFALGEVEDELFAALVALGARLDRGTGPSRSFSVRVVSRMVESWARP